MYWHCSRIFLSIGLFLSNTQLCFGLRNPFQPNFSYLQCISQFDKATTRFCGTVQRYQSVWGFLKYKDNNMRTIKLGDKLTSYLVVSDITENYLLITNTLSNEVIKLIKKTNCE